MILLVLATIGGIVILVVAVGGFVIAANTLAHQWQRRRADRRAVRNRLNRVGEL